MSKEALKLALEALEEITDEVFSPYDNKLGKAITALREALAEQPARPYRQLQDNGSKYFGESWDKAEQPAQQEPVAWMEMVVANLVREGVNKHKARELAQHFAELVRADERNATLDEIAKKIEAMPFGDTAASFAVWIREQKS